MRLIKPDGIVGLLTPSGIYADKTAARFFKSVSTSGRVGGLFDFENKRSSSRMYTPHSNFAPLSSAAKSAASPKPNAPSSCMIPPLSTTPDRCFPLAPSDFARVNPNTGTAPIFRTRRDADITRRIYENHPVLVDRSGDDEVRAWPVRYVRMFDMTNDSHLFRTAAQLEDDGFYPVQGNRWKKGEELYLPLYEGKMVQAFDHRAASIVVNPENLNRPAQPRNTTLDEHSDPHWMPAPQFWVNADSFDWMWPLDWGLGFKEITAATNHRTMIATVIPKAGCGNKTPVFLPVAGEIEEATEEYKDCAVLLAANFNSPSFDFVARQKIHGQTLNLYILEQLPIIAPADYDRKFGPTTARDLVRDHVLRLTYTAHDMAPLRPRPRLRRPALHLERRRAPPPARPPRRPLLPPLRPPPRRRRLHPRHLPHRPPPRRSRLRPLPNKDMVLAYYNALAAGDTDVDIAA